MNLNPLRSQPTILRLQLIQACFELLLGLSSVALQALNFRVALLKFGPQLIVLTRFLCQSLRLFKHRSEYLRFNHSVLSQNHSLNPPSFLEFST